MTATMRSRRKTVTLPVDPKRTEVAKLARAHGLPKPGFLLAQLKARKNFADSEKPGPKPEQYYSGRDSKDRTRSADLSMPEFSQTKYLNAGNRQKSKNAMLEFRHMP